MLKSSRPLRSLLLLLLPLIPLLYSLDEASAALFGIDNRRVLTPASPYQEQARATAISVLSSAFRINDKGFVDLDTTPLTQLCTDELMHNEPSLPFSCTGFLVAPDLLATAGHCVYAVNNPGQEIRNETGLACEAFSWLFDYQTDQAGISKTKDLPAENLYRCKRIIYAVHKETAPYQDYALIQLDRPVKGRTPLKISRGFVPVGSQTFMIGHPFGTPKKFTDQGRVLLNNLKASAFVTNLDAFEGNSGSPVFNSKKEVIGILVSGTPSTGTYTDTKNKCERVNRCKENGTACVVPEENIAHFPYFQVIGSDVQRILPLLEWMDK